MSARVDELMGRMSIEQKAAALLVARVVTGDDGSLWEGRDDQSPFGFTPTTELVLGRHVTHLTVMNSPSVRDLAAWGANIRELAATADPAIPVSVAADPMHGRVRNMAVAQSGEGFSRLPEPIGLAATGDVDLVRDAARMVASELRAAGIHIALHPMADLSTEPRWARIAGTFGEDPDLASRMTVAYVEGLQAGGAERAVASTAKHFPGGGPQRDGHDAHFAKGAHAVYPGGRFDDHLAPFAAAVASGVARIMPGYAAPLGIEHDAVGFAFQRSLITGILRDRLGFDGVVITDFNIVTGMRLPRLGLELPVRAWGLLDLTPVERVVRLLDAGVDQLGGEDDPQLVLDALESGLVTEERIDASVRRILAEKERLGLFDDAAAGTASVESLRDRVRTADHQALARRVQEASVVALQGEPLNLDATSRVYVEGIAPEALDGIAEVVTDPAQADAALLRIDAPFEPSADPLEAAFHSGSLEFTADEAARLAQIAAGVPTVIAVFLDRPAVLTAIADCGATLLGEFGIDDDVLVAAATGRTTVTGRLPFDLPRSMAAVEASREDVPFDTADPLFRFGHGEQWPARAEALPAQA